MSIINNKVQCDPYVDFKCKLHKFSLLNNIHSFEARIIQVIHQNLDLIESSKDDQLDTILRTLSGRFKKIDSHFSLLLEGFIEKPFNKSSAKEALTQKKRYLDMDSLCKRKNPQLTGALLIAVEKGAVEEIRKLVRLGAEINRGTENGVSPIYRAAQKGRSQTIKVVKELGAKVDILINNNGDTPIHVAAERGELKVIQILQELGANIDTPNNNGDTPIHVAVREGHLEIVQLLYSLGANINTPNNRGDTPIHSAAERGELKVVQILQELGANIDIPNNNGDTPIHVAVREGHLEIVQLLYSLGANINTPNNRGDTLMHIATSQEYPEIIKLLVNMFGVDINAPNQEGLTPLYIAILTNQLDIQNELISKLCEFGIDINIQSQIQDNICLSANDMLILRNEIDFIRDSLLNS